jgi:hypothetical protein
MAAGDLKGDECVVITVTSGAAITAGQVVHLEADGYWYPCADADTGKFGVALDAASAAAETIRVCIWGRVEVTATAATIAKGECVMAGASGAIVASDYGAVGENVGTAMEAFPASGGTGTVWIGLVN